MNFVFPDFLYFLSLLGIPVIIHLFNFRRFKKVEFTNVRFLKELKEETTSRSRIKHLLVLLSRLLALACLVLAFAQPFIPLAKSNIKKGATVVSVFVDNSFSMELIGEEGSLLQQAKDRAKEIVLAYQPGVKFQLLTNAFNGAEQRLITREEFINQVDQISISPSSQSIQNILLRQKEALVASSAGNLKSYIISDFQNSTYNLTNIKNDTNLLVNLVHINAIESKNIFIDTCFLSSPVFMPGQSCDLKIKVRNAGNENAENVPVKLLINGTQKAVGSVNVSAGSFAELVLSFTVNDLGWQKGVVNITDYPLTFDDNYYFSFNVESTQTVIELYDKFRFDGFSRLFGNDKFFKLISSKVDQVDYSLFNKSQLIILNHINEVSSGLASELEKFVNRGGTLLVVPDSGISMASFSNLSDLLQTDKLTDPFLNKQKLNKIDQKSDIYKPVFESETENLNVPVVSKLFIAEKNPVAIQNVLLRTENGSSFLSRFKHGLGRTYLFFVTFRNTWTDFGDNWLFAPTIYRMAMLSNPSISMSYTIGINYSFSLNKKQTSGDQVYHLVNPGLKFDIVPLVKQGINGADVFFSNQIKQSGWYDLELNNKQIAVVAMNYNRKESVMEFNNIEKLESNLQQYQLYNFSIIKSLEGNVARQINERNEGVKLWKAFIIAALLFLLAEVLLLKLLK